VRIILAVIAVLIGAADWRGRITSISYRFD